MVPTCLTCGPTDIFLRFHETAVGLCGQSVFWEIPVQKLQTSVDIYYTKTQNSKWSYKS